LLNLFFRGSFACSASNVILGMRSREPRHEARSHDGYCFRASTYRTGAMANEPRISIGTEPILMVISNEKVLPPGSALAVASFAWGSMSETRDIGGIAFGAVA
jgi:hypothetical protein